jgi:dTDP-4-amino-4,6-dideoxygalactose transaminase
VTAAPFTIDKPAAFGGTSLFSKPFRFVQPSLPPLDRVIASYRRLYGSGIITNGDLVARLEGAAAERLNARHCVAVSSCTAGLLLTMRAMDLRGDVLLPSFTFFATGHALLWNRLRPVFVDIDPETWTIDPSAVKRSLTRRTSAILGVHLYGNPCAIEELSSIAAGGRVKLLFDAAHAFGSEFGGSPVGGFGDAEVFSLSPTKILVAGEGGLVTTNDATLARRLRAARNYGDAGTYDCELLGINARLSEFHAALALNGLESVRTKVERHNDIARTYDKVFGRMRGLRLQTVRTGNVSTYKDYSVHVDAAQFGMTREDLAHALKSENIETRKYFYPPLHKQKLYGKFHRNEGTLPVTEAVSSGILSLPIGPCFNDQTVAAVAYAIERLHRYVNSTAPARA